MTLRLNLPRNASLRLKQIIAPIYIFAGGSTEAPLFSDTPVGRLVAAAAS